MVMRNGYQKIRKKARTAAGIAAVLSTALIAASPALATEYLFDLTQMSDTSTQTVVKAGFNSSNTPTTNGNSLTYTKSVTGSDPLTVKVTGWSINTYADANPTNDKIFSAKLWSYLGNGLGVDNQVEPNTSPDHAIDNDADGIDFVVLQFSRQVDLNSLKLGWIENDSDVTVRGGGLWNATPFVSGTTFASVLDSLLSINANGGTGSASLQTRNVTSNLMSDFWIVSAAAPNPVEGTGSYASAKADYFKLKAVSVNDIPPVPEPSTWMLMIAGFGAVAGAMRRRRQPAAAAALTAAI